MGCASTILFLELCLYQNFIYTDCTLHDIFIVFFQLIFYSFTSIVYGIQLHELSMLEAVGGNKKNIPDSNEVFHE